MDRSPGLERHLLMSSIALIGILLLVAAFTVAAIYFLLANKMKDFQSGEQTRMMDFMRQDLSRIESGVKEATTKVEERLNKASEYISELNKEIGQMREIGQSVKNFQALFTSQKLRGGIGEQVLAELLELSLPKNMYSIQYKFRDGTMVDAVLKVKDGLIPIDSKFPLENYRIMMQGETEAERLSGRREFTRDVKKHITDIAAKYIKPDEKVLDFAVMYMPSESVYAAALEDDAITTYAREKNIVLTSPNHFYHMIQIMLVGVQAQRVSEAGTKILEGLKSMKVESDRFKTDLTRVNSHITNAKNSSDSSINRYEKFENKLINLMALEVEHTEEVLELEKEVLEQE